MIPLEPPPLKERVAPMTGLDRLLSLTHRDPHSLLGAHPASGGIVVRAWRVDARSVRVFPEDGEPRTMRRIHSSGLFEARFPERPEVFRYELEVEHPDGSMVRGRDPYSFLPTLGDLDLHLFGEGRHARLDEKMGAHPRRLEGASGIAFSVWAPNAEGVSVVGDWNGWDGRRHPMRMMGSSGIWEIFIPDLRPGALYKFEIHGADGRLFLKSDPYGRSMEVPPQSASIVHVAAHEFRDEDWVADRSSRDPWKGPISIYEAHLGSWCRVLEEGHRPMTYREIAPFLAGYVKDMGFTHIEFLPLMEHPFGPSWGYQVSGYYAPSARYGSPDDFAWLVDYFHRQDVGVILDWVPAHFLKDAPALGRFDGTALYEHWDRRLGEHPDWDTYVFNYGRHEVRNFLISNALFWLERYHVDGLRLDAVASMLYLDYSRRGGDWIPNAYGGRENLEAMAFLKELNERIHSRFPHALMIAEESTAWPAVSRPTYVGGLGFGFKWNMGWMHDTLEYFSKDPVHRRHHHSSLTFGLLYAWNENFILPLSHDEVVHGKRSLLSQMPGDRTQKFANLRSLYAHMWAHPGKKLLFMGGEIGQWNEWFHDASLDWHLLEQPDHRGLQALVRDLNRTYRGEPALWEADFDPSGFEWIDCWDADGNILAYLRKSPATGRKVVVVSNLSNIPRPDHRLALPGPGRYREILNTDAACYGGGNRGNGGSIAAEPVPHHGRPWSSKIVLPPLTTLWFEAPVGSP